MEKIDFVDWVESELKKREWRRTDLAQYSGVSNSQITRVLNREQNPGIDTCQKIAKAFKVNPEDVYRIAGILPPEKTLEEEMGKVNYSLYKNLSEENQKKALEYMEYLKASEEKGAYRTNNNHPVPSES